MPDYSLDACKQQSSPPAEEEDLTLEVQRLRTRQKAHRKLLMIRQLFNSFDPESFGLLTEVMNGLDTLPAFWVCIAMFRITCTCALFSWYHFSFWSGILLFLVRSSPVSASEHGLYPDRAYVLTATFHLRMLRWTLCAIYNRKKMGIFSRSDPSLLVII